MAANLEETVEFEENNMEEDLSESTIPLSSSNLNLRSVSTTEQTDQTDEIHDEREEEERNPYLELKRCKEWLQQQKVSHEAELLARRLQQAEDLQPSSSETSQSDLHDRISKLQDQLYSLSTARSYKKLVLDRVLCGDQLVKKLFPDTVTDSPTEENIETMKVFAKLCEKQNKLSSEILAEHESLMESQMILDKLKKESYEIKKENREYMKYLQKLKEEKDQTATLDSDNSQIQQLKHQLNQRIDKIEIVRNVFQGLIVGSGIDWASDEEMRSLVLSLGEPLEFK